MQCLYCGNELGLLKELTDGEFCSRAHRQRYKKLANIAVHRLLGTEGVKTDPMEALRSLPQPLQPIAPVPTRPGFQSSTPPPVPSSAQALPIRARLAAILTPAPDLNQVASGLSLTATPTMAPEARVAPARLSVQPVEIRSTLDRSSVCSVSRPFPVHALPRLELPVELGTVARAAALALAPQPAATPAAAALPAIGPVPFRSLAATLKPAFPDLLLNEQPATGAARIESHRPCLQSRSIRVAARALQSAPIQGPDWQFSAATPRLPAASSAARSTRLSGAPFEGSTTPALPASAAPTPAGSLQPLDFSAPGLRLLRLGTLDPKLTLRRAAALEQEILGADVASSPVNANNTPGLVGGSMLPALASLFRYSRPVQSIRPLPLVSEGVAAQNCQGRPLAYMEIAIPAPKPLVPRCSPLGIVETFQYLRPLEEPQMELLQSLVHLWKTAPAYLRLAAVSASVILLLCAAIPGSVLSSVLGVRWSQVETGIRGRAAVELSEDFQDGMENWDGNAGWSRSWRVEKAGYVTPGRVALYQPSMKMESYRMEFLVEVERQAAGWAYRATDENNYYAAKLTVARPGPLPLLSLVRYPVIRGQAGPRVEIPIRVLLHNGTPYRVELNVKGTDYSTSIEGQLVDYWHDERFRSGGVGFFSDGGERARIYWMKLSQQDDFVGRVCAYFYPSPIQTRRSKRPK